MSSSGPADIMEPAGEDAQASECLEEAVGRGVTQYVILGSGFDSFAFRRPDLGLTVFEVGLAASIQPKPGPF